MTAARLLNAAGARLLASKFQEFRGASCGSLLISGASFGDTEPRYLRGPRAASLLVDAHRSMPISPICKMPLITLPRQCFCQPKRILIALLPLLALARLFTIRLLPQYALFNF